MKKAVDEVLVAEEAEQGISNARTVGPVMNLALRSLALLLARHLSSAATFDESRWRTN